jgi:hypothetical protein
MKCLQHHASRLVAVGSLVGSLFIGTAAQAQTCPSFPIALPAQLLINAPTNSVIMNIADGDQLDNFGWLTWTGDMSDAALVASLTPPGNSDSYVNPDNPADNQLDVGDWVSSRSGVSKKNFRKPLDNLLGVDIIVPVFDDVRVSGSTVEYHIAGFAQVQLVSYRLPQNIITIYFIGFADCSGGPGV